MRSLYFFLRLKYNLSKPFLSLSNDSCIIFSLSESRALVASSKIKIFGFLNQARAEQRTSVTKLNIKSYSKYTNRQSLLLTTT